MTKKPLTPRSIIKVEGKLSYSESSQAWSIIRFKSELVKEFPQLKEKRSNFTYKLVYYRNIEELEKAIKKLKKDKDGVLPLTMFLCKEF